METISIQKENDPVCLAILFSLAIAEFKISGYDEDISFTLAVYDYAGEIKSIASITKRNHLISKTFNFSDQSSCTFQDGYVKFHSPVQSN